jgi:hypothetical protein
MRQHLKTFYRKSKKNTIKDSYEKESAVSFIKEFVIHLWNPEMGYLNKQL